MRYLKFFLIGIFFGVVLIKSEVVSWFRIFEMFHFDSFHMYGVIFTAIAVGATSVLLIKKFDIKSIDGSPINLKPKPFYKKGNLIGGIIFGFGWALTGACPGPLYALLGNGLSVIAVPLLAAVLGAFVYEMIKSNLPH